MSSILLTQILSLWFLSTLMIYYFKYSIEVYYCDCGFSLFSFQFYQFCFKCFEVLLLGLYILKFIYLLGEMILFFLCSAKENPLL